jgi:signal transduction histidine kinase
MRVPLWVQIAVVAALFVAAIGTLVTTAASIAALEVRRASARGLLDQAGQSLAARGAPALARAPRWPNNPELADWDALDRELTTVANAALASFDGVEGGYYLDDFHRFLGGAFPTRRRPAGGGTDPPPRTAAVPRPHPAARQGPGPPPLEYELIEDLVDSAIRSGQVRFIIQDVPPSTVAIRAAPIATGSGGSAATWTMIRLVDPLFLDRSARGFRLAAGLALSGFALAMGLTWGLVRTVRRQNQEREKLQTELRRSERLAALGKLLAGVAHEIRNPLAGIHSTVQLWSRGIGPDDASIADVVAEVDRIETIVARLLQFSRAQVRELVLGDLNAVVAEAARLASGPADAQGVTIELDLAAGPPMIAMSAPELLQVFRNLTANALQAMSHGGTLRLSTRHDPRRQTVEVDVADTGPGLDPRAAGHLFEPFFTTRDGGTGLGLAIAREIALAHRGDLRSVSPPGAPGATFRLTLPAPGPQTGGKGTVAEDEQPSIRHP